MSQILVMITLSDSGIETIKSTPELPNREMEYVNKWKDDNILDSFYISVTKKDAVLIFKNVDEQEAKRLIACLPYFPYMTRIDYHILDKQF